MCRPTTGQVVVGEVDQWVDVQLLDDVAVIDHPPILLEPHEDHLLVVTSSGDLELVPLFIPSFVLFDRDYPI